MDAPPAGPIHKAAVDRTTFFDAMVVSFLRTSSRTITPRRRPALDDPSPEEEARGKHALTRRSPSTRERLVVAKPKQRACAGFPLRDRFGRAANQLLLALAARRAGAAITRDGAGRGRGRACRA